MGFFRRLLYKFSDFMQGRYGMDALYIPMLIASCGFTLLGTLFRLSLFRLLGFVILVLLMMRFFSKNYAARQRELNSYYHMKHKITSFWRQLTVMKENHRYKRYFKCPKCKVKLSVPKGKGKIQITCRKCGHQFIKKT